MKRILDFRFWILDDRRVPSNPKSKIQNQKCVAGFALVFLLMSAGVVEACPACKEALFDPSQLQQRLSAAKGYALSIILLLSVPLSLIVGVTMLIVRSARRKSPHVDTLTLSR